MLAVKMPSAITLLCDCPCAGKSREVKLSPENDEKKRNQLKKELKETKRNLILTQNAVMNNIAKLSAYKRLLCLEMGWDLDPSVASGTSWKKRVREVNYLKSKLIRLVDYLRERDPQYKSDPAWYPTKVSASAEDLLLEAQEKFLGHLYLDYSVYYTENEKKTSALVQEYLKMKEMYENQLYWNKLMEKDINDVKKQISNLKVRFMEDKVLIDYITAHKFEMKGTFLKDETEAKENEDEPATNTKTDAEAEKLKHLWEQSVAQKKELMDSIRQLKSRVEFANSRIVRSEEICVRNITDIGTLLKKIRNGVLLSKTVPDRKETFGKFSHIDFRSKKNQLEAAIGENKYLRNFLRKAILSKAYDLKYLQNSLLTTADKYRAELEKVRNKTQTK